MSENQGRDIALELIAKEFEVKSGFLDLGNLALTTLPDELWSLQHLRRLNLSKRFDNEERRFRHSANLVGNNNFSQGLPPFNLPELRELFLSDTSLYELSSLKSLLKLEKLYCYNNPLEDISPIQDMAEMLEVLCYSTHISDLKPFEKLYKLQGLNCSNTSVFDLAPLQGLINLQGLYCHRTAVFDPAPLINLPKLQDLNLSECKLKSLPKSLLAKSSLKELFLYQTSIPGIPSEFMSHDAFDNCRERLLAYFQDIETGAEPITDVKVVILGNGRIGKTQLCNRLNCKAYQENAESTHGIMTTRTGLSMYNGINDITLNLWDFGGQELYHSTHTLFLKTEAIFILVWLPFSENTKEYTYGGMRFRNQPLAYWVDYIRHSTNKNSPIIVVQSQCDSYDRELMLSPELFRDLGYTQQLHYSARIDRKRDTLNDALREAAGLLCSKESISVIGKGPMKVRRQIERWIDEDILKEPNQRKYQLLSQQKFRELCESIGDISSPDILLSYLHSVGVVFYQKGLFCDHIILDQNWALDAIYTVFHRSKCYETLLQSGGHFTRTMLDALVWSEKSYSVPEQELFISMMESCGICFLHRERDILKQIEAEYIAPDLLPQLTKVEHLLKGRWNNDAAFSIREWQYDFLLPSAMRNLISKIGKQFGDSAVYWKSGMWIMDEEYKSCAIISQEMHNEYKGMITVKTQGRHRDEMLEKVSELIQSIFTNYVPTILQPKNSVSAVLNTSVYISSQNNIMLGKSLNNIANNQSTLPFSIIAADEKHQKINIKL